MQMSTNYKPHGLMWKIIMVILSYSSFGLHILHVLKLIPAWLCLSRSHNGHATFCALLLRLSLWNIYLIFTFCWLFLTVCSISDTATKDTSLPTTTILINHFPPSPSPNCFRTANTLSRSVFKRSKYERLKEDCRADEQWLVTAWQENLHSVIRNYFTGSGRFMLNFWQCKCIVLWKKS
jgi:hypothetical protein